VKKGRKRRKNLGRRKFPKNKFKGKLIPEERFSFLCVPSKLCYYWIGLSYK
jgi:hypothetical protein